MSRIPRQAKRDAIEPDVVRTLEAGGCFVAKISGAGVPDLICCRLGAIHLIEVKSGKRGRLTEAQQKWKGPTPVLVRSVEDALTFLRCGAVLETEAR